MVTLSSESPGRVQSIYHPLNTFSLPTERSYRQQYGDLYFLRLSRIKPVVEAVAEAAWGDTVVGGKRARRVERVLDVRQGELCWVAGTVYMDMRLKPNILDDVTKDNWNAPPVTIEKYWSDDGSDEITLEDDSGRIKLAGDILKTMPLVTGCIIAVMGTENANGEFGVVDIKVADLPPQPERWTLTVPPTKDEDVDMVDASKAKKIAFVSGLAFSSVDASAAAEQQQLLKFLLDESGAQISRLVVLGNSISTDEPKPDSEKEAENKRTKKYGYDANTYNPVPSQLFDDWLAQVLTTMPVTLLPGEKDPANASYPQQPIHSAMFPRSRQFARPMGKPTSAAVTVPKLAAPAPAPAPVQAPAPAPEPAPAPAPIPTPLAPKATPMASKLPATKPPKSSAAFGKQQKLFFKPVDKSKAAEKKPAASTEPAPPASEEKPTATTSAPAPAPAPTPTPKPAPTPTSTIPPPPPATRGPNTISTAPPVPSNPPWLHATTNPCEAEIEGWRVLATSGQNVSDVFKYLSTDDRLGMMEAMCRWRCCAPTAPDTLWTYPFQDKDPFVMDACPHLFVVGCQPRFEAHEIAGPEGQTVRLVAVPAFVETKELVLVDVETLDVSRVPFGGYK